MKYPIFQVDAFAENSFSGNPAAVVVLKDWIDVPFMQKIAEENNLAETAFLVPFHDYYEIRWFTPAVEVDLCGHATLASAFVIMNYFNNSLQKVTFKSMQSGILPVSKFNNLYELDFPLDNITPSHEPLSVDLLLGIGAEPKEVYKGKTDYMLVFDTQEQIEKLDPDFTYLKKAHGRGIIVTAPGERVDFVSRFFAPQVGINEDPVTGSAHTTLIPYWGKQLNKDNFVAKQLSKRGGTVYCKLEHNRAKIAGPAILYMKGEIEF